MDQTKKQASDDSLELQYFAMFMFIALSGSAEEWAFVLKDKCHHELKMKINNYLPAAKALRSCCSKFIDYDKMCEDATLFSQILEYIHKAKTMEDKKNILSLLQDFVDGNVMILDDHSINQIKQNK